MRIGVFSDSHLGATLYRGAKEWIGEVSKVREEDIRESFNEAIEMFRRLKPDVVVHLGDLMEGRASARIFRLILDAADGLERLLKDGIRVILLEGNHDYRRYDPTPQNQPFAILERILEHYVQDGRLIIVRAGEYRVIDDGYWPDLRVPIVAVGYHEEDGNFIGLSDRLREAAGRIGKPRAILLLHQTVGDFWGIPSFYPVEDIPEEFSFIFNGHIHKRKMKVWEEPFRIFVNVGSVEYQDISEAWSVDDLADHYGRFSSACEENVALEMLRRLVFKGAVVLDLNNPKLRNLMDPCPGDIEGDEVPYEYWNSSREPIFYYPLKTSRPFLRAEVREDSVGKFCGRLDEILNLLREIGAKEPVLHVDSYLDVDGHTDLHACLRGLLEDGRIVAFRSLRWEEEGDRGVREIEDMEDPYAPFGEYASVVRDLERELDEWIELEERKSEAPRGEKRKIEERIEEMKERLDKRLIGMLRRLNDEDRGD
ncbi:MAG: hypothetical protein GXO29_05565 [Thermotogae bacterium]|nr:hypothetical protein [Thermotogota bacterium]